MCKLGKKAAIFTLLAATVLAGCAVADGERQPAWPDEALDEGPPLVGQKADGADLPAYAPLPPGADLDQPLAVLFAPDDPVTTLELKLIEDVAAARELDLASPTAEGDNPYRIRYAVYNLRNPDTIQALISAQDRGVDVQILIEEQQLDPRKEYNQADEQLVAAGFELLQDVRVETEDGEEKTVLYVEPQTSLDEAELVRADIIAITGITDPDDQELVPGLMHLKTRLFETPTGQTLLTGSLNPGDNAVMNEETLHLIRDPQIIARYQAAYKSILAGERILNEWHDGQAVNVMFTPEAEGGPYAGTRLLEWIEEEQEQVLVMVFSLNDFYAPNRPADADSLLEVLLAKVAEGVPVYAITDRKQSDGVDVHGNAERRNSDFEDRLRAGGVHVFEAINNRSDFTAMHHKVAVLGRTNVRIVSDACNWSYAALGSSRNRSSNVESMLFIDSTRLDGGRTGRRYLAQWMKVLARYASQAHNIEASELSFAEVLADLQSRPGWPAQSIQFEAWAQTVWGQSIAVRGNQPALGNWTEGPGVILSTGTEPFTYPHWGATETVPVPLGAWLEWKLVKICSQPGADGCAAGSEYWEGESGINRNHIAGPPVLSSDETQVLSAEFLSNQGGPPGFQ